MTTIYGNQPSQGDSTMNERTEADAGWLFPEMAEAPAKEAGAPRRRTGLKGKRDLTLSDRRKIWNAEVLGGLSERQISQQLRIT